jgi:hypothetical protein
MAQLGVASVNEIRSWENLNPVENGDERFVQLNMQTLNQAAAASAAVSPSPAPAADTAAPASAAPAAAAAAAVADVSLNGAQITGLLAILTQLSLGTITGEGAKAIIASSFPSISPDAVDRIIAGTTAAPAPTEPAPAPAQPTEGP